MLETKPILESNSPDLKSLCICAFDSLVSHYNKEHKWEFPSKFKSLEFPLFVTWSTGKSKDLRGCIGTFQSSELETQLRELEIIKAENIQLQQYLHLSDKYANYNTVPAYVINRDVSNFSSTLVLNVGTNDGIEEKMTVIADKGLVGHVISVTPTTCKVQVIIDSACTVSSMISTTQESIICKGTLENKQILRASYIPTGAELIQGDNVYTSGVGGIYPKGIIIGTIKDIITTSNITDRYATVEPAVDFSKLDTVLIIIDK
jgi:rod shape-determining protein MreC